MTLSDFQGHSTIAGLVKCSFSHMQQLSRFQLT